MAIFNSFLYVHQRVVVIKHGLLENPTLLDGFPIQPPIKTSIFDGQMTPEGIVANGKLFFWWIWCAVQRWHDPKGRNHPKFWLWLGPGVIVFQREAAVISQDVACSHDSDHLLPHIILVAPPHIYIYIYLSLSLSLSLGPSALHHKSTPINQHVWGVDSLLLDW